MSKSIAVGGSWFFDKTVDLGSGTTIDANIGSVFRKITSSNISLNFSNLSEGRSVTVLVKNEAATAIVVTLPALQNSTDVITSVPSGRFLIYKIIMAYGSLYASSPLRSEAYFA